MLLSVHTLPHDTGGLGEQPLPLRHGEDLGHADRHIRCTIALALALSLSYSLSLSLPLPPSPSLSLVLSPSPSLFPLGKMCRKPGISELSGGMWK